MGNRVLCEYGDAIAVDQIRDSVMDFRVNVVRAACKYDSTAMILFYVFQGFFAFFLDIGAHIGKLFPAFVSSSFYLLSRDIFKNLD